MFFYPRCLKFWIQFRVYRGSVLSYVNTFQAISLCSLKVSCPKFITVYSQFLLLLLFVAVFTNTKFYELLITPMHTTYPPNPTLLDLIILVVGIFIASS
jgi:hypothetical protein